MSDTPERQSIWTRAEDMIQAEILTTEDMFFAEGRRTLMVMQELRGMSVMPSAKLSTLEQEDEVSELFNLIPFMGEKEQVVFSDPACYFAVDSELEKPEHEARKEAALQVIDFISTPEGQEIIRGSSTLSNSYLNDVEMSLDTRYQDIKAALDKCFFRKNAFG